MTLGWAAAVSLSWVVVAVSSGVLLPYLLPAVRDGASLPSLALVALVVPLSIWLPTLDEPPSFLIATAGRRLSSLRSCVLTSSVFVGTAGAVVVGLTTLLDIRSLTSLVALLWGAGFVGTVVLGGRTAWVLPLGIVLVFSVPRLVPWDVNVIYNPSLLTHLGFLAGAVLVAGSLAYVRHGSKRGGGSANGSW
ncbi:hypothetical protein [Cellulosimicrobium marinum]|uniref:hypothetical protein n=1 Tax=Cellulosimicrobium marinum TaxID=1638992 RepID=UPI001E371B93|nr:hypothetical protein [Cellulosimicrobium marinum]MCB7135947.1 hypothetical protein [Cellulosimicrobium marinum]